MGFGVVVVVGVVVVLVGGTIVLRYIVLKDVLVDVPRIEIQIRGCTSTPSPPYLHIMNPIVINRGANNALIMPYSSFGLEDELDDDIYTTLRRANILKLSLELQRRFRRVLSQLISEAAICGQQSTFLLRPDLKSGHNLR